MANLKGSTYQKQIRNSLMRMEKFNVSRHLTDSKDIHSLAVFEKREMMLRDFAKYAEETLQATEKLNLLMTNENISSFLNSRLESLQSCTVENYTRGFSAMMDSLRDNNINISVDRSVFDNKVSEAKSNDQNEVRINRSVDNINLVLNNLYNKHFCSGAIAEAQVSLGFRVSEAEELVSNLDKYLDRETNTISGIVGKGGQEYQSKEISQLLISKIEAIDKHISHSTYVKDLKEEGITSHDFRYTFAKETYYEQVQQDKSHQEALLYVSKEMNHHRADITSYYLSKT